MNNAFDFREDFLHSPHDDREVRSNGVAPSRKSYDKAPVPFGESGREEDSTPTGESKNGDGYLQNGADSNDSPTWLRRFSVKPGRSSPESYGWNDFKKAFKFGKPRRENGVHPNQRVAQHNDDSDEQVRMRASNLITTFIAAAPVALMAMTSFSVDDHGLRRAPLLLPMVGFELEDITGSDNHRRYSLNLEYGVGPDRLKWSVIKDSRDFLSLHSRLKLSVFQRKNFRGEKKLELPKFPREKINESSYQANTLNDKYLSVNHRTDARPRDDGVSHPYHLRPQSINSSESVESNASHRFLRRIATGLSRVSTSGHRGDFQYNHEQYTKKLETYLKQLMLLLSLRPEANRLFHFLELSPIGVLLSYENCGDNSNRNQGKQGYLIIASSAKAQGWRVGHLKISDLTQMVKRHTSKWFLVRSSYIMYVSDIYSTTPLDVFLFDPYTRLSYNFALDDEKHNSGDNGSFYDDGLSIAEHENSSFSKNNKIQTHFTLKLENGERSLKLIARSENQAKLWIKSIQDMISGTVWTTPHRFHSFAPVRSNCAAQWFVDGRDHFWAVSSAMEMAQDVIYIHDWWLSPELYMRRPANGNQEFRLDRILKRKAEQGVKIFVIVYRNVGSTVVTDSSWTKHSLIGLHQNIHVLRSPNQWLQNTYFWAHHEKLCIIDHTVAFVGGIDLCYGRYDTPDHVLVDDSQFNFAENRQNATEESIKFQKFPGKDYSNPRVKDFYGLDKPYESMYDREAVPRMPWHDVHMMTAGQAAGDLSRHFVQRWNYLLRQKRPSRPTPLLTPPPDFSEADLERFNLTGTCEVQLLRSSGNWSLGLNKVEKSIQEAYLKLIETSEHFVYIENQFFITSTSIEGTVVENRVGDALVDRIIRAHSEGTKWKAVIVIPLMPGFESQVDEADGSAVRVIMQCQYMSISRGETSIFAKLKKMKINPDDYIQFFSLRKWGRIGPHRKVVCEQLYIHSKILLVDDRVALIGSANINERSQLGNRDSEVAAVVRDTDTVDTTMNGEPYKAGNFCHTLRMRLMREHLGVDVDILDIVERRFNKLEELAKSTKTGTDSKTTESKNKEFEVRSSMVELASRDVLNQPDGTNKWKNFKTAKESDASVDPHDVQFQKINQSDKKQNLPPHLQEKSHEPASLYYRSFNNRAREENVGIRDKKQLSNDSRLVNNAAHKRDVEGNGEDRMASKDFKDFKVDASKTLRKWAKKSLLNEKTDVFLPNVEQVLEFLEDDSFIDSLESLSTPEEIILHERNKQRWELLKRVAYLQRVAAKQKIRNDEENSKRSKVGLPLFNAEISHQKEKETDIVSTSAAQDEVKTTANAENDPLKESPSESNEIQDLPGDNIPVVSLSTEGIEEMVQTFNEVSDGSNYNKFIDPYAFNDPLVDSFYEDVLLNNAIRNTLIFREVFHCQPDDTVVSWKQYKEFSRLNTAFSLAQDQEIARYESHAKSNGTNHDSYSDSETSQDAPTDDSGEKKSINLDDINNAGGKTGDILGKAPPTDSAGDDSSPATGSSAYRKKRRGYNALKGSPLGTQRVFDRATADRLASEIQGHLVVFPVDWLSKEIESGNWFYNMDRLPPVEIYD
jgi:phospholipase D1/2